MTDGFTLMENMYALGKSAVAYLEEVRKELGTIDQAAVDEMIQNLSDDEEGMLVSGSEALAHLVWLGIESREPDCGDGELLLVRGIVGTQRHSWLEIHSKEPLPDSLPRGWILDVAPAGGYAGPVLWDTNSPFQMLYRKGV